jgi:hypothetical protein
MLATLSKGGWVRVEILAPAIHLANESHTRDRDLLPTLKGRGRERNS